jgi:hypothetical protein
LQCMARYLAPECTSPRRPSGGTYGANGCCGSMLTFPRYITILLWKSDTYCATESYTIISKGGNKNPISSTGTILGSSNIAFCACCWYKPADTPSCNLTVGQNWTPVDTGSENYGTPTGWFNIDRLCYGTYLSSSTTCIHRMLCTSVPILKVSIQLYAAH